jgi:hypothetical protein
VASRWRSAEEESRRGPSSAQKARLARDDNENRSGRQRRLKGDAIRAAVRCGAARRIYPALTGRAKLCRACGAGVFAGEDVRVASRWRSGEDESRRGPSSAQRARLARDDDENRSGRQRRLQRQLQRQLKRRLKRQLQPNSNGNCSHPSQRTRRVGHPEHRRVTATAKAKAKQTQKQTQTQTQTQKQTQKQTQTQTQTQTLGPAERGRSQILFAGRGIAREMLWQEAKRWQSHRTLKVLDGTIATERRGRARRVLEGSGGAGMEGAR